jgi:hypothetical protein
LLSQKSRHFIAEVSHYQRTKIIALAHNGNGLAAGGFWVFFAKRSKQKTPKNQLTTKPMLGSFIF